MIVARAGKCECIKKLPKEAYRTQNSSTEGGTSMTLVEGLQDKLQSWKEAISPCAAAEPDVKSKNDETYVSVPHVLYLCGYIYIYITSILKDFTQWQKNNIFI